MKIQSIEYENFRNFKDHGQIDFSTDGKVTIIYGKNGDGKTTFHQFIKWIFYGDVDFNKTTTKKLYNLSTAHNANIGDIFEVKGIVNFVHDQINYQMQRIVEYKKSSALNIEKIKENISLLKENTEGEYGWNIVTNVGDFIEKLLPSGLSPYFFFDGETMIADLKMSGTASATKLKKALFNLFNLDVYQSALNDLGNKNLKSTAIGSLYLKKGDSIQDSSIQGRKNKINSLQEKIQSIQNSLNESEEKKGKNLDEIKDLSEQIGTEKSKAELEDERKRLKGYNDSLDDNIKKCQKEFGRKIQDVFPMLLISKAAEQAKFKINLRISNSKLPLGLQKELIDFLLKHENQECICGRTLSSECRDHLKQFYLDLPPYSYSFLYKNLEQKLKTYLEVYEDSILEPFIKDRIKNADVIRSNDKRLMEIEEEEKKIGNKNLHENREKLEKENSKIDETIKNFNSQLQVTNSALKKENELYEKELKVFGENQSIDLKLNILEQLREYFSTQLDDKKKIFSEKLREYIQTLTNKMLTCRRTVNVSNDFAVTISDSYNDESKSEGQFAVVSFAYIGGIFRLLSELDALSQKEYPLVLDGPFSKLDIDQRLNVVNVIPNYAPQIILFSKDSLQDVFDKDVLGKVWTIKSNDEKNIATIEEGYQWK